MRLVVVGAGIAGLAAALEAQRLGAEVTIVEASERVGGKLRTERFAGRPVDCGADAFLVRRPEATSLASDIGLTDLVPPASGKAHVLVDGALRTLPVGSVLGVPGSLLGVARSGILPPAALVRLGLDVVLPGPVLLPKDGPDVAIGELLRARLGNVGFERLVDPLLSGINAGDADHLSLRACVPQLAAALSGQRSVVLAARRTQGPLNRQIGRAAVAAGRRRLGRSGPGAATAAPVFLAPRGGMEQLAAKASRAFVERGGSIVLRAPAATVERHGSGLRVVLHRGAPVAGDGVVVALPPGPAAGVLADLAPDAASTLAGLGSSSVALVALAYERRHIGHPLDGSGFLVPREHTGLLTACSWFSQKWPHAAPPPADGRELVVLRASAGRAGDERALALDDDELVRRLHGELVDVLQLRSAPTAQRVTRWTDGFPLYEPGHGARMRALLAALPEGVSAAGATYEGVGVPACIASGRRAAARLVPSA